MADSNSTVRDRSMRIQDPALQIVVEVQARQFGREQCYRGGVARLETGYTNIRTVPYVPPCLVRLHPIGGFCR